MPMPKGEEAVKRIHLCTADGRTRKVKGAVPVHKDRSKIEEWANMDLDVNDLTQHVEGAAKE